MTWTESLRCNFEAYPDDQGHPSRIYINVGDSQGRSLLDHKQRGSIFLSLRKGTSWEKAMAMERALKESSRFHVRHSSSLLRRRRWLGGFDPPFPA